MIIKNSLLQRFLEAITEQNRIYDLITKKDMMFCELIFEHYDDALQINTKEDVFSFYYITELDNFVLRQINKNQAFCIDPLQNNLSEVYYNLLNNYYQKTYKENLDEILWIKETLVYIDNKCETFRYSNKFSKNYTDEVSSRFTENQKSNQDKLNNILNEHEQKITNTKVELQDEINVFKEQLSIEVENIDDLVKNQEKKSIENNITILGIFVGIVAVLFGGISFVSLLSDKLLSANPIKSFMLITFMAIILFDSILALFYYISKVTDKNLISSNNCWTQCKYMNNKNDKYSKLKKPIYFVRRAVCTIAQKSKFAFWSNVVLTEFLLFLFILYLLINNGRFNGDTKNGITFGNVIIALFVPTFSSLLIAYLARPCKCYYEYAKKSLLKVNKKEQLKHDSQNAKSV